MVLSHALRKHILYLAGLLPAQRRAPVRQPIESRPAKVLPMSHTCLRVCVCLCVGARACACVEFELHITTVMWVKVHQQLHGE